MKVSEYEILYTIKENEKLIYRNQLAVKALEKRTESLNPHTDLFNDTVDDILRIKQEIEDLAKENCILQGKVSYADMISLNHNE